MKKCLKISLIFILLITAIIINKKASALMPLSGKIIVIDPGHGGIDPGTTSDNVYESKINLEISKQLEVELNKVGVYFWL